MMKPKLSRAGILLIITLALPLALMILYVLSRSTGDADITLALVLFCTVSLYVSLAAGLLVPVSIVIVSLLGGSVERRRIVMLLLLSVLNIAVAIAWIFFFIPHIGIRW
jgi:hypothetical protein